MKQRLVDFHARRLELGDHLIDHLLGNADVAEIDRTVGQCEPRWNRDFLGNTTPVESVELNGVLLEAPTVETVDADGESLPQAESKPSVAMVASAPATIRFIGDPFGWGTSVPDFYTGMGSAGVDLIRERLAASTVAMASPTHTNANPTTREGGSDSWKTSQPRQKLMVGTM